VTNGEDVQKVLLPLVAGVGVAGVREVDPLEEAQAAEGEEEARYATRPLK
jgi:hypothetical protein